MQRNASSTLFVSSVVVEPFGSELFGVESVDPFVSELSAKGSANCFPQALNQMKQTAFVSQRIEFVMFDFIKGIH
jgi:hypothetical protein